MWYKMFRYVLFVSLLGLLLILGCNDNGNGNGNGNDITGPDITPTPGSTVTATATPTPVPPTATPTPVPFPDFAITFPSNNAQLSKCWNVWMTGQGMRQDYVSVDIRIFTNKWWSQTRKFEHSGDPLGSWKKLVDFGGKGIYNNHTIDVVVKYADGSEDHDRVTGIVCASQ